MNGNMHRNTRTHMNRPCKDVRTKLRALPWRDWDECLGTFKNVFPVIPDAQHGKGDERIDVIVYM